MFEYRIYTLSGDNHITGPADHVESDSDEAAIAEAKKLMAGLDVEVWQGTRCVIGYGQPTLHRAFSGT